MAKKYFDVDVEKKVLVLTEKNYAEMTIPGSEVYKAIKAALEFYPGYVPVRKETKKANKKNQPAKEKNTKAQAFTADGIIEWIIEHKPTYYPCWMAMAEMKQAGGSKWPFMVRKNVFLFENPDARSFCGINNPDYELTENGRILKDEIENWLNNRPAIKAKFEAEGKAREDAMKKSGEEKAAEPAAE